MLISVQTKQGRMLQGIGSMLGFQKKQSERECYRNQVLRFFMNMESVFCKISTVAVA